MTVYSYYPVSIAINAGGHFLDSLIMIYFLHKFFTVRKPEFERFWKPAVLLMTVLLQLSDLLSHNSRSVWMLVLVAVPFLYSVLFQRENPIIKFSICGILFTMQAALESLGVTVSHLAYGIIATNFSVFLAAYIFRRIFLKLIFFLAVKFFLDYSIYEQYYELRKFWYLLSVICLLEYALLGIRQYNGDIQIAWQHLIIDLFCCFVPLLFYYVVYLIGTNTKRLQISINQKNYIETQEQYMSQLLSMQASLNKFKHDYQSHMFCIDNLLMEKNYDELHAYLQNIHDIDQKHKVFQTFTADQRINIILNQMNTQAVQKGIHFQISAQNVSLGSIPLYDLNMLLSNLYNNAIEAAFLTEEKSVSLLMEKTRGYLRITIENSVTENPVRVNPNFLTSKKDRELHGFGMQIIQSVVDKYSGMMQMEGSDERFKISVLLADET